MTLLTDSGSVNWFRPLRDGRLEVCLAGATPAGVPLRLRASGAEEHVWAVVDWFEDMTGREVVGEWRRPARRGPRPIAGQLSITEQLESGDDDEE